MTIVEMKRNCCLPKRKHEKIFPLYMDKIFMVKRYNIEFVSPAIIHYKLILKKVCINLIEMT